MILEKIAWLISKTLPVHVSSFIYISGLLLTIIITRGITIHHIMKHHLEDMARDKMKQLEEDIIACKLENKDLQNDKERLIIKIKTIKAVWEDV